jgi:hypothetical protein
MRKLLILTSSLLFLANAGLIYTKFCVKNNQPQKIEEKIPNSLEQALDIVSEQDLRDFVEKLSDKELEGRMSGKNGNKKAADYIDSVLDSYNIPHTRQRFNIKKGVNIGPNKEEGDSFTENIIAYIISDTNKDDIIVLGAHFDHIGYGPAYSRDNKTAIHPGADDNASGVSMLLELAKILKTMKLNKTVCLQFYSGEEMGLLGSKYYCNNPVLPLNNPDIKKHIAMINLDMVGYLDEKYIRKASLFESSVNLREFVYDLNDKYSFAKKISSFGPGSSDHSSFYNKKIPIAFIHTGVHPYYHTSKDTPEKLNYKGMVEITKFVLELVNKIDYDNNPEFTIVDFKPFEANYDHEQIKFGE